MVLVTDRQLNVNCHIPLSLFFNGIVYIKRWKRATHGLIFLTSGEPGVLLVDLEFHCTCNFL